MDILFDKFSKVALVIAGLTVIRVFPWNIYTIFMAGLTIGFILFRMFLSISTYKGLWTELTTPRAIIDDLKLLVYTEEGNFWSDYKYRLKDLKQNGQDFVLHKIIYVPIINKVIRRSYSIYSGVAPQRIPSPQWMNLVTTKAETHIPFPNVVEAYKEMGYSFDMVFDQSDVKCYRVFKNEGLAKSAQIPTKSDLFIKINGKWKLVTTEQASELFNRLSEVGKMQLNVFNITCSVEK